MPLTVDGFTLTPEVAGPPPETHILDVRHFPQEGKLWCWAACVQMVLEYYARTKPESGITRKTQCEIVRELAKIEAGEEPTDPCPEDRQKRLASCAPDDMKKVWVACNIQKELRDGKGALIMGVDDTKGIKKQIKDGKPIQVGITWDLAHGGGGHALLIKGWTATKPESLVIDDPLRQSSFGQDDPFLVGGNFGLEPDGSGRATRAELKGALGHGQWNRTWFDLA